MECASHGCYEGFPVAGWSLARRNHPSARVGNGQKVESEKDLSLGEVLGEIAAPGGAKEVKPLELGIPREDSGFRGDTAAILRGLGSDSFQRRSEPLFRLAPHHGLDARGEDHHREREGITGMRGKARMSLALKDFTARPSRWRSPRCPPARPVQASANRSGDPAGSRRDTGSRR